MAKCHRPGAGSRRFPSISTASLRRRLIAAVSCGCTAPLHPRKHRAQPPKPMRNLGSDRLSELLKIDISDPDSDPGTSSDDDDSESETRRKIEAFEELQGAVKGLQRECGERRRAAAAAVRRLAKGDAEARKTLAMLGAIPPLIGMIESDDLEAQISALYALLNLGIGNDM